MTGKLLINILVFLLVVVLIFVVYGQFFGKKSEPDSALVTSSSQLESSSTGADTAFQDLLNRVQNIDLAHGQKFLANPLFSQQLEDFSRPLPVRPVGRSNPFLPINPADAYRAPATTTP